jgi:hypothetical protein
VDYYSCGKIRKKKLRWFKGLKRFVALIFSAMSPKRDVAIGKNSLIDLIGSKRQKVP